VPNLDDALKVGAAQPGQRLGIGRDPAGGKDVRPRTRVVPPLNAQRSLAASALAGVVRESYGRLLALLAAPGRDIAAAEDALADAVERALARWPDDGVPDNPEAWLLVRCAQPAPDVWKSAARQTSRPLDENRLDKDEFGTFDEPVGSGIPDRRLELMLVCAHPCHRGIGPHAADAAGGARRRCPRPSLPPSRWSPRPWRSAGAREEAHPGHRHPLRDARSRAARRAPARGT